MIKMKKFSKVIAVLLAFAMAFTVLPYDFGYVWAASEPSEESTDDIAEEVTVLSEIIGERDEYTKRFKMSDGTVAAAQYDRPVHYLDEDENWVDFDNTLIDAGDTEDGGSADDAVNVSSDFNVRFSKKSNGNKIITVKADDYKLSWNYEGINKTTVQTSAAPDDGDMTTLDKLTSEALYANAFADTDIQYLLTSNELKENIILNSKNAPSEFIVNYKGAKLSAEQINDKTIHVNNENGETVFVINAPYMTDANGVYSDGITLEIVSSSNNKFAIKTVLDKEWLSDSERVYPVTVDPIFATSQKWKDVSDDNYAQSAYISSSKPNSSFGRGGTSYEGSMYVGKESGRGQTRSFIKFNQLPQLAECDKVVDARMYLYKRSSDKVTVNLYRVTGTWSQSTVTWNNAPSVDESEIYDYKRCASTETASWAAWEITELVRGWYSGEYENHGIMMQSPSETSTASYKRAWFFSTTYTSNSALRPFLVISYRNMSGYEDYYSYTSIDTGRSGVSSVNNYNGNLTFTQYLTESAGGNLMPVNLSLIYNSNKGGQAYSSLGDGMQTNYHLYIAANPNITSDSTDEEKKYKYYLNDADGTAHYFYFENLTDTTAKDEDGLGYTITVDSSVSETSLTGYKYTVEDKSKNKMYFNGYGYLVKVEDSNGNASTVAYTVPSGSTVPRINIITDGAGRVYTFIYGNTDTNLVTAVRDPANRQTTLTYTDGKISSITYADSKTVSLTYNSGNNVSRITGINSFADVAYDIENRVSSMIRKNGDTVLESYSFSYKQNETVITDYMERSYTYQFNDYGQTTGIVSNINGEAQFFSYTSGNSTSGDANKLLSESKIQTSVKNYIVNPTVTEGITDYSVRADSGTGNAVSYDSSIGHFSNGAVKISKATTGSELVNAYQTFTLPAGTYTLSAYVKSDGEITGDGAELSILSTSNGSSKTKIASPADWQCFSAIIETTSTQTITAQIGFPSGSSGTIWVDDIQLEQNTGEGSFNLVENPGFSNSTSKWTVTATTKSVVTLADGDLYGHDKALKISSDVTEQTNCVQTVNVSGSKGDVFAVGAWAKAHSAPLDNGTKDGDTCIPEFKLQIEFFDSSNKSVSSEKRNFNPDVNTWQFNSFCAIAGGEYAYAKVSVIYNNNINELSTTGIYCNKEEYGQTYTYDKDGNVVSSKDLASTSSSFAYKGNQMSMLLNPSGSSYLYSYDSDTNNLLYANSTDGQQYSFTYDEKGNVTQTVIEQSRPATTITSGKTYVLRNAYSGNAMRWNGTNAVNNIYISGNTDQQWIITVSDAENSVYTLKSVSADKYLNIANSTTGTKFTLNSTASADGQKFKLQLNENGTYRILTAKSSYAKCVDGQPGDSTETDDGTEISQQPYVEDDLGQQWYLYPLVDSSEKKMTSSATYTENKNYVSTVTDAAGNTVSYNYDTTKGTLTSTTDAKNNTLQYSYDINNRVTSIYSGLDEYIDYEYLNDRLDKITAFDNVVYDFTYDAFGNTTRTRVGNGTDFRTLSTNTYDNYGRLSQMTYGNGNYVNYFYDSLDRLVRKEYNGDSYRAAEYKYNNNGSLSLFIDYIANETTRNIYDLSGRLVAANTYNGTNPNSLSAANNSVSYRYADKTNYLTGITHTSTALGTSKLDYTYGDVSKGQMPDQIYNVKWNGTTKKAYVYDGLGRITGETVYPVNSVGRVLTNEYTYQNAAGNNTTALVSGLNNAAGNTFYTYDANGNIIQTRHCDSNLATLYYESTYGYDKFNQLTGYSDQQTGKSYTFAYDDNGNITTYKVNGVSTKAFGYTDSTWGDLLTSYNGNTITYDAIGNPLTYKNGETFTWQNGRQLNFIFNADNDITAVYSYDADGKRISKYTDAGDTFFTYAGDILAGQKTGDNVLVWMYDNNGTYIGFTYNGTEYYYVYNLQGDVVALANSTGTIIARYTYGPWGTVEAIIDNLGNDISGNATHIANINPIRYRGYYYDAETGFYYLQSRYYDPEICRFINADGYLNADYLLGYNAFAYCYNNPVLYVDHTGCAPSSNEMLKMVLGILPNPKGYTSEDVLRQQQAESRSNYGTNIALGIEYDLGGGWKARIDGENTNTKVQRHVHVEKGKQKYSQNYDGSPHDGSNGSPPNSVLKKLKDKLGWDWKEKEKNYNNRKDKIAIKDYEYSYNYGYNFNPPPITGDTTTPAIIEWIIKLFNGE